MKKKIVTVRLHQKSEGLQCEVPKGLFLPGTPVIVDTEEGLSFGFIDTAPFYLEQKYIKEPIGTLVRKADAEDLNVYEHQKAMEKEAEAFAREEIARLELDMNLLLVSYQAINHRMIFTYTADDRVDFRELVRNLALKYHLRIEMRQIGARDETALAGGLGRCGRAFCCSSFMRKFPPISVKMAKTQNLSINPAKISGPCGRLLCCLKYEQEAYEQARKTLPKKGKTIKTVYGEGEVLSVDLIRESCEVRLFNQERYEDPVRVGLKEILSGCAGAVSESMMATVIASESESASACGSCGSHGGHGEGHSCCASNSAPVDVNLSEDEKVFLIYENHKEEKISESSAYYAKKEQAQQERSAVADALKAAYDAFESLPSAKARAYQTNKTSNSSFEISDSVDVKTKKSAQKSEKINLDLEDFEEEFAKQVRVRKKSSHAKSKAKAISKRKPKDV